MVNLLTSKGSNPLATDDMLNSFNERRGQVGRTFEDLKAAKKLLINANKAWFACSL